MKSRLIFLIDKYANGKQNAFAELTGIPKTTLNGYLKNGKIKNVDHLVAICAKLSINSNWLLTGQGPIKLDQIQKALPGYKVDLLNDIDEWLERLVGGDPGRKEWFRYQFEDAFPMFTEWKKRKESEENEDLSIPDEKIA